MMMMMMTMMMIMMMMMIMVMNYNSQAACFHLPRLIWKHSEGGLMKMLVGNLTDPMMIINVSLTGDF